MSSPTFPTPVPVLCQQGWHAHLDVDGLTYVRFATRITDEHGTYIYRIGPYPDDRYCVTIWCYEDKGVAWTCSLCGRPIIGLEEQPDRGRPMPD